jgi:hypothetical protein
MLRPVYSECQAIARGSRRLRMGSAQQEIISPLGRTVSRLSPGESSGRGAR